MYFFDSVKCISLSLYNVFLISWGLGLYIFDSVKCISLALSNYVVFLPEGVVGGKGRWFDR